MLLRRLVAAGVACSLVCLAPARAQDGAVKALFEKYNLIGAFSFDCGKPADSNNWRFVNRVVNGNQVERAYMASPTRVGWSSIITKADDLGSNEILLSLMRNGKPTVGVWRLERNRMLQWQAEEDGKTLIADGKWLASGRQLPWLNKCGN